MIDTTKRKWTAEERRDLAAGNIDGGFAGPDQSFPIADPADVADAWGLAGQAANPDQVRRKIIAIAKRFGWQSGLPDTALAWAEERGIALKADNWSAVKALGGNRVGGYAVLWGDADRKDLTGEYFTQRTEDLETLFKAMGKLPLLYQHASDGVLKTAVVGPVDVLTKDEMGLWYEAQLSMADKYRNYIDNLVEQGLLGTSSGTLPAARRVNKRTGEIERWAIAELSLTPTPAEPRMMERPVAEVAAAFKAVGLELLSDDEIEAAKAGRRLSSRQLKRLAEARETIDDLVRWASYEDGNESEPSAGFTSIDVSGDKAIPTPATELGDAVVLELPADNVPATEHGDTNSANAVKATGPEDGQAEADDALIKDVLIETERLALLKLTFGG